MLPKQIPIAYKLSAIFSILIITGMSLLGTIIVQHQVQLIRTQINKFGFTVIHQMAESAKEPLLANDTLNLETLTTNLASIDSILGSAIYAHDLSLVSSTGIDHIFKDLQLSESITKLLDGRPHTLEWHYGPVGKQGLDVITLIAPVSFNNMVAGHVVVTLDQTALNRTVATTSKMVIGTTIVMTLIGIFISFVLGKKLSRPIHNLLDASEAINAGEYGHRIKERRNDEIGELINSFNKMADGLLEKTQLENALSRYVSRNVAKTVLADLDHVELGGEHVSATVLFADIAGFTAMSEDMDPKTVASLLNEYFSYIDSAAAMYRGTVDKFIGDCAMIVFGVPEEDTSHAFHATACALLITRLVEALNRKRNTIGLQSVDFRIGLNSGDMLAGNMGSHERMQYTVVGDAVNLAARLCSQAEPRQVVVAESFMQMPYIKSRTEYTKGSPINLRGKTQPVTTYQISGLSKTYDRLIDQQVDDLLSNFLAKEA